MTFLCCAAALSMSDRMPYLWRAVLVRGIGLGAAIERGLAIDLIDRSDVGLSADQIGHLVLWASGMFTIGLVTRKRFEAASVAVALFMTSLALEVGQSLLTTSRSMSIEDAVANAGGIMAGLTALVILDYSLEWRASRCSIR